MCPDSDGCIDLGSGGHVINASVLLMPDNSLDEDLSNNESSTEFETIGGVEITFTLTTDLYPGETSWNIEDDNVLSKQTMKYLKSFLEKSSYFFIDKIFNDK